MSSVNRGIPSITTNLGISLFDESSMPTNEIATYIALVQVLEDLGTPDEFVLRKEDQNADMAIIYKDVDGSQVFLPLIGFSLESKSQGNSFLKSFMNMLEMSAVNEKLNEKLEDGMYRYNFDTKVFKQTRKFTEKEKEEGIDDLASAAVESSLSVDVESLRDKVLQTKEVKAIESVIAEVVQESQQRALTKIRKDIARRLQKEAAVIAGQTPHLKATCNMVECPLCEGDGCSICGNVGRIGHGYTKQNFSGEALPALSKTEKMENWIRDLLQKFGEGLSEADILKRGGSLFGKKEIKASLKELAEEDFIAKQKGKWVWTTSK